jgi:hypothetical protein
MWTLSVVIFAACKWITWQFTPSLSASAWRQVAYLAAWPGLDAKAFLDPHPLPRSCRAGAGEWGFAVAKLTFGVALVWGVSPRVPGGVPLLRGWVGMAGLILLLHFGSFHLMSCAWRSVGVDAKPLMNWPVLAVSVSEFWGKRWNTAFRDLTHRFLFRPLAFWLGARAGLAAGFIFSGVIHDLVISLPAGGGYGCPTLYFALQGVSLLAERSGAGKQRFGLGKGWRGRLFAAVVIVGPACGLFHPRFVSVVVLPFLDALGANSTGGEQWTSLLPI